MSATGVRRSWLLREACHRHWLAIAEQLGAPPPEIRDRSGARVLASVVACTINGDAEAFREDDHCQIFMTEAPCASNGWRSQSDLNTLGKSLRVEILTSFARRNGRSNVKLGTPELHDGFRAHRDHPDARRACLLRTLGCHDRTRAANDSAPPHLSFDIHEDAHINGVGLVYFANIHDMMEQAERNAAPEIVGSYPMRDRRMHFFGNLDVGDRLEITAGASARALFPRASVVIQSHAKRASDGQVIACAESVYGG